MRCARRSQISGTVQRPCVGRIGGQVQLGQPARPGDRVAAAVWIREAPAPLAGDRVGERQPDDPLQAQQPAHDQRAVRPGIGQRGVQLIPARLSREAAGAVPGDPARERRLLAQESAGRGDGREWLRGGGHPRPLPGSLSGDARCPTRSRSDRARGCPPGRVARESLQYPRGDIDKLLTEETGLPVVVADDPLTCVARGGGRILELMDELGPGHFGLE